MRGQQAPLHDSRCLLSALSAAHSMDTPQLTAPAPSVAPVSCRCRFGSTSLHHGAGGDLWLTLGHHKPRPTASRDFLAANHQAWSGIWSGAAGGTRLQCAGWLVPPPRRTTPGSGCGSSSGGRRRCPARIARQVHEMYGQQAMMDVFARPHGQPRLRRWFCTRAGPTRGWAAVAVRHMLFFWLAGWLAAAALRLMGLDVPCRRLAGVPRKTSCRRRCGAWPAVLPMCGSQAPHITYQPTIQAHLPPPAAAAAAGWLQAWAGAGRRGRHSRTCSSSNRRRAPSPEGMHHAVCLPPQLHTRLLPPLLCALHT